MAGQAFFKWAVFALLPWSRAVAIAALAALMPVGFAIPTLALSGLAGLIVVVLAVWDTLTHRKPVHPKQAGHHVRMGCSLPSSTGGYSPNVGEVKFSEILIQNPA